jgi:hypothetical protein
MAGRPTKYAHVTRTLPKLPLVEPERRDIVEAVKAEILAPPSENNGHLSQREVVNLQFEMQQRIRRLLQHLKVATEGRSQASEFARVYTELRVLKDDITTWLQSTQLLLDGYQDLMLAQFENEGLSSLRMLDGGSISTYSEPYAQVKDREKFRQWCLHNGFQLDMHLHSSKTQAILKELLLAGETEPDGIEVFAKTMVRLNKP